MRKRILTLAAACMLAAGTSTASMTQMAPSRNSDLPPIVIQGSVTVEKSQADAQIEAGAAKEKAVIDKGMVGYTRMTAGFTGAIAIIALFQAALFLWQLKLLRQSTEIASIAADAAREAAQVARDSFTTLERPWIFLEKHRVERREGAPIKPTLLNNYYISLLFKNNGRSPAFIDSLAVKFIEKKDLPETPDFSTCTTLLRSAATLAPGDDFESGQVGPAPGKDTQYTIYGWLTYRDVAGGKHHTGFAIDVSPHLPAASVNENQLYDFHD